MTFKLGGIKFYICCETHEPRFGLILFLRPLQDGVRYKFLAEKRKQLFKQFKNWLDSGQFSAASLNLHHRNVNFSDWPFLTCIP